MGARPLSLGPLRPDEDRTTRPVASASASVPIVTAPMMNVVCTRAYEMTSCGLASATSPNAAAPAATTAIGGASVSRVESRRGGELAVRVGHRAAAA